MLFLHLKINFNDKMHPDNIPVKGAIALRKNHKIFNDDEEKRGIAAALPSPRLPSPLPDLLALPSLTLALLALALLDLALLIFTLLAILLSGSESCFLIFFFFCV